MDGLGCSGAHTETSRSAILAVFQRRRAEGYWSNLVETGARLTGVHTSVNINRVFLVTCLLAQRADSTTNWDKKMKLMMTLQCDKRCCYCSVVFTCNSRCFMLPPAAGRRCSGGIMQCYIFMSSVRPSVRACVYMRASVMLFARCLWYALTDFYQTSVHLRTKMSWL